MEAHELYSDAAQLLFRKLATDHHFEADALGLDDEMIGLLASLDFNDQTSLIKDAAKYLNLSIDAEALKKQLQKVEFQRCDREIEDYYLIKYAPYKLMHQLFGLHATEFSQRRKRLGIDGKTGRPVLCDEQVDSEIWKLWQRYLELDLKNRYVKVAELSNQNIDTIWASLQRIDAGLLKG
jgi:hypothetical protein